MRDHYPEVPPPETAEQRKARIELDNCTFLSSLVRLVAKGRVDFSFFNDPDARYGSPSSLRHFVGTATCQSSNQLVNFKFVATWNVSVA